MDQENLNQTSISQVESKSKRKLIIILLCFLIAGVTAIAFVKINDEEFKNKKESRIQQKLNQNDEVKGSIFGETTETNISGPVSYSEDYTVSVKKDITYATVEGTALKIDIYTPVGITGTTPAIMYVHGGGFKGGSKNGVADDAEMLAKHGVAVVAVDYRLSGVAEFPAQIYDVKGATRFIKANASTYNIDPNRIFSLGESAGGVLASLLGVAKTNTEIEGTIGGNTGYDSGVVGVINISGSYVASIVDTMGSGIKNAISAVVDCSPVPSTACESEYEPLSPEIYIDSSDAPFIILHGEKDQSVPTIQATTLDDKLENVGIESEIYIATDLSHVGGLLSRYLDEVISFINKNI